MSLLQADASSINLKDKKEEDEVKDDAYINIVSDNALLPMVDHISVPAGLEDGDSYSDQISVYVVRKGDSISVIADMFDVSIQTILSANDLKKGDKIREGDVLFILPVSGIEHTIIKGQTLKSIAKLYGVEVFDITQFNGINADTKLVLGEKIMIPGADSMVDAPINPTNTKIYSQKYSTNTTGYFINPVPGAIKTQGLHGKNAVDLAAPIGTPIYASASGKVLLSRTGWNGAYGNVVIIQHSNGTKTLYSHLSKLAVSTGDSVFQGEVIGYVGNTGRVRAAPGGNGAHLHFEVYNAKNPGSDGSWKR